MKRVKKHKHPLIIDGVVIPKKYTQGIHRRCSVYNGKTYIYYSYRATGRRIDVSCLEKFYETLSQAKNADALPADNISRLITAYMASQEFLSKSESTKRCYGFWLQPIIKTFGQADVQILDKPTIKHRVLALRDALSDTPSTSKQVVTMMSILADFAIERRKIHTNHIKNIKTIYKPVSRADDIFTDEDINNLLSVAPDVIKHAVTLALFTAQRKGDLLNMKWENVKGNFIEITQQKTKKRVFIPIYGQLRDFLNTLDKSNDYILAQGAKNIKPNISGHIWQSCISAAGLKNKKLHFHDLRGTAITRMMEQGADRQTIEMIAGNSSVLDRYMSRNANMIKKFTSEKLFDIVTKNVQNPTEKPQALTKQG